MADEATDSADADQDFQKALERLKLVQAIRGGDRSLDWLQPVPAEPSQPATTTQPQQQTASPSPSATGLADSRSAAQSAAQQAQPAGFGPGLGYPGTPGSTPQYAQRSMQNLAEDSQSALQDQLLQQIGIPPRGGPLSDADRTLLINRTLNGQPLMPPGSSPPGSGAAQAPKQFPAPGLQRLKQLGDFIGDGQSAQQPTTWTSTVRGGEQPQVDIGNILLQAGKVFPSLAGNPDAVQQRQQLASAMLGQAIHAGNQSQESALERGLRERLSGGELANRLAIARENGKANLAGHMIAAGAQKDQLANAMLGQIYAKMANENRTTMTKEEEAQLAAIRGGRQGGAPDGLSFARKLYPDLFDDRTGGTGGGPVLSQNQPPPPPKPTPTPTEMPVPEADILAAAGAVGGLTPDATGKLTGQFNFDPSKFAQIVRNATWLHQNPQARTKFFQHILSRSNPTDVQKQLTDLIAHHQNEISGGVLRPGSHMVIPGWSLEATPGTHFLGVPKLRLKGPGGYVGPEAGNTYTYGPYNDLFPTLQAGRDRYSQELVSILNLLPELAQTAPAGK